MSSSEKTLLGIKDAYDSAVEFARHVLGDWRFTLEEIDREEHDNRDVWVLTLGYPTPEDQARPRPAPPYGPALSESALSLMIPPERSYKKFFVDAHTGEVLAMRLREPKY